MPSCWMSLNRKKKGKKIILHGYFYQYPQHLLKKLCGTKTTPKALQKILDNLDNKGIEIEHNAPMTNPPHIK